MLPPVITACWHVTWCRAVGISISTLSKISDPLTSFVSHRWQCVLSSAVRCFWVPQYPYPPPTLSRLDVSDYPHEIKCDGFLYEFGVLAKITGHLAPRGENDDQGSRYAPRKGHTLAAAPRDFLGIHVPEARKSVRTPSTSNASDSTIPCFCPGGPKGVWRLS